MTESLSQKVIQMILKVINTANIHASAENISKTNGRVVVTFLISVDPAFVKVNMSIFN
jgi:hypothetical protein